MLLFVAGLLVIVAASELFTNSVEWAGYRLRLGAGATGSLLAALGTALPETIVPVVALLSRAHDAESVAIGAVLGGPFLLFTLGFGITGIAVVLRRRDPVLSANAAQLRRDIGTFFAGFSLLALSLLLPLPARVVVGLLLVAVYGDHARRTLRSSDAAGDVAPEPLHLLRHQRDNPHALGIAVQLLGSTVLLVVGADIFVRALTDAAPVLHINTLVLAVLLVPVATELPETLNSVLWVRTGDDTLAAGNIAGATAFQACLTGAIGVAFTGWRPGAAGLLVGAVTVVAGLAAFALLREGRCSGRRLMLLMLPWAGYTAAVLALGDRIAST